MGKMLMSQGEGAYKTLSNMSITTSTHYLNATEGNGFDKIYGKVRAFPCFSAFVYYASVIVACTMKIMTMAMWMSFLISCSFLGELSTDVRK